MARTRSIKPEFWSDEKLALISRDARLLFIGLWSTSDDAGTSKGHPKWIKSQIYPYDDILPKNIEAWLKELVDLRRVLPYNVNGEKYLYIPGFIKHQKIQHPSPSKNPPPPEGFYQIHETFVNPHETFCNPHEQTETETEVKQKQNMSGKTPDAIPFEKIIDHLNEKAGKDFKATTSSTKKHIQARWNEGHRVDHFLKVIDVMCSRWLPDPKMMDYLRPETLFGTKFESYLNNSESPTSGGKIW